MPNKTRKQRSINISHDELIRAWKRTITYLRMDNLNPKNQKEIERELLRCFKKAVKELKSDKGADY